MLSKSTLREVLKAGIGFFTLGLLEIIIFYILNLGDIKVILGTILGVLCCIVNFYILALAVENNYGKAAFGTSYMLRLLIFGAVVFISIKAPYFNYFATIIPLLFRNTVLFALSVWDNKKRGVLT